MQTYYYFFYYQSLFICFLLFQDYFSFLFIFFVITLQLKSGKESLATDFPVHFRLLFQYYFAKRFEFYYLYFHLYIMSYLENSINNHFSFFLLLDHLSVHQWHLIDHHYLYALESIFLFFNYLKLDIAYLLCLIIHLLFLDHSLLTIKMHIYLQIFFHPFFFL